MDADALATMRRCNAELEAITDELTGDGITSADANRWVHADAGLHLSLLHATGNQRMVELVGNLRIMAQVFGRGQRAHADTVDNRRRICGEHESLIEALESGDLDRAQRVLSTHIRTGLEEAKRLLAERMLTHRRDHSTGPVLLEEREAVDDSAARRE
jgi:DNA-binding FadR family transcriptional regulator